MKKIQTWQKPSMPTQHTLLFANSFRSAMTGSIMGMYSVCPMSGKSLYIFFEPAIGSHSIVVSTADCGSANPSSILGVGIPFCFRLWQRFQQVAHAFLLWAINDHAGSATLLLLGCSSCHGYRQHRRAKRMHPVHAIKFASTVNLKHRQ